MQMNNEKEDAQFGPSDIWRLIARDTKDDVCTTVRVLAIQGKGLLVQTAYEKGEEIERDAPILVENVVLMEYMSMIPSEILDDKGQPNSMTRKCVGRELISVKLARDKFQPPKPKGQRNGQGGNNDHLMIIAGAVLTMEQGPAGMKQPAHQPTA
jgi:hypothetical protein